MIKLMKDLIKLVPELKGKMYLAAVLKMIETIFAGAPYIFLFLTMDDLLAGELSKQNVLLYSAGAAGCFLMQGVFFYLFSRAAYPAGALLSKQIRILVGEHLRKLSMGYFSNKTTGYLNSLVADELMWVSHIPTMGFPQFVTAVTYPTAIALFLSFIDWRLTLAALAVIPLSLVLLRRGQMILSLGVKKRSDSLVNISSAIIEYVQGMDVVKAFKQSGKQFKTFDAILKKFKEDNLQMVLSALPPLLGFKAVLDCGLILVLLIGAFYLLGGSVTLSTFLIFLVISLRMYEPLKALGFVYEILRVTEPPIEKIKQLLETEPLPQPARAWVPRSFEVEFRDVTFAYEDAPVLKNINFTIPEKTITALVGPSGSGKTTITNLMVRFWDVSAGEIRIGGRNIKDMQSGDLLALVSIVFQDVYLFNDTIYNNIAYGSKTASPEQIREAARTAQCHDFISALPQGYQTMVGEGGATLSGGEKQRVSIARAILKDAPIILLDEATASVDPENEQLIQKAINALVESKTLIIVAHRLSTITTADKIIVLDGQGGIAETGRHDGLISNNGLYQRFWKARQQAVSWRVGRLS